MNQTTTLTTLQSTATPYTTVERASAIYNGVLDIFDYTKSSDVVTPFELALKQVRQLPTSVGKVLVPGAGIGTYILALLQEGFKPEQITAVELNPAYARLGYGIFNRLGVNYVTADFLSWQPNMQFDVIIGNPPYQAPKKEGKKGPGGDNALFVKFIDKALDLVSPGGYITMLTPSSAIVKSTVKGKPTSTLNKMLNRGALVSLNLDANEYFKVGSFIGHWLFKEGEEQRGVNFTKDKKSVEVSVQDIFYCPPVFEEVEFSLFKKIVTNTKGSPLYVTRNKPDREYCMNRLGYPKIAKNGPGVLGFDAKHSEFMLSQLGLWLLDYVRRHDQFIYHNLLTGICVPPEGFDLTYEESQFINSKQWRNFGVNESKLVVTDE